MIPTPSSIGTTIRSVRRARQILTTLVQFGFREVVEEFGLASILGRGSRLSRSEHSETGRLTEAQRVRRVLEELGPTFAKVGQVLSTRPDLIPEEWAEELRHLQAGIAPVPWSEIEPQLEAEFGEGWMSRFTSVDPEPMAAASMAQVHRAVLADGSQVVLKILRPGIQKIIEADMEILRALASLLEPRLASAGYSATAVVEQFANEIIRETDLLREGRSTERMARDFADDDRIVFPRVFWEATTRRVLALEEIHGQLVTKLDPETLTREERHAFVAAGTDAVFRQCLVIGFFHADPHPGNLFHLPGNRIAFIDCGMTGYADPRTVSQLADLVLGAVNGDLDRVLDAALSLAEADQHLADDRGFRAEVWRFIDHFRGGALSDLRMGVLLQEFFELLRRFRLQCPPDMVHLIKAITTIEGVAEQVAPDFDVIAHVRPYIERLVRQRAGLRAIRQRVERTSLAWAELAETAPRNIRSLLDAARNRDLGLRLEHNGLQELERTIASAATTIGFSVVIAAMVIGGAVLVLADMMDRSQSILTAVAIGAFIAAGILGVLRLVGARLRQPRGGNKD